MGGEEDGRPTVYIADLNAYPGQLQPTSSPVTLYEYDSPRLDDKQSPFIPKISTETNFVSVCCIICTGNYCCCFGHFFYSLWRKSIIQDAGKRAAAFCAMICYGITLIISCKKYSH